MVTRNEYHNTAAAVRSWAVSGIRPEFENADGGGVPLMDAPLRIPAGGCEKFPALWQFPVQLVTYR